MNWKNRRDILELALSKIDKTLVRYYDSFPYYTKNGKWENTSATKADDWVSGFWVGLLWIAYLLTSNEKYATHAHKLMDKIDEKFAEASSTNLGYLYGPSFILGYKITEDPKLKTVGLKAANRMLNHFDEKTGFFYVNKDDWEREKTRIFGKLILPKFPKDYADRRVGVTAIDPLPSLTLLWWAHKETNDEKYYRAAASHSLKTFQNFIRKDGSLSHLIFFDLDSGEILQRSTLQGHDDKSCWSRGQAWGICGFSLAYQYTQDIRFKKTLEKISKYFIKNLPADGIPFYDMFDPNIPNVPKDTSASAIACSGWDRYQHITNTLQARNFKLMSESIKDSLVKMYLQSEDKDGLLKDGCYFKTVNLGVNESLIWGDYFFLQNFIDFRYKIF